MCTVVDAGAPTPMVDVGQVKLSHRDVFVFFDGVIVTRPDVDNLVIRVAVYEHHVTTVHQGDLQECLQN